MHDETDIFEGVEVPIREVAGGFVLSGSPEARLSDLEARLAAVRETQADTEATLTRVEEAEAAYAEARERRRATEAFAKQASTARWGQAVADALLPPRTTARVRESVHPLGHVITGPHSHGSVRHDHPRLPYDHLHCPSCGGDSRLCLDNPHHEPGAIPARESDTQAQANAFVGAMEAMFDGQSPRPLRWEDMAAVQAIDDAAQAKQPPTQATAADMRLSEAWERACGGSRP